jgi:hypothetical protein
VKVRLSVVSARFCAMECCSDWQSQPACPDPRTLKGVHTEVTTASLARMVRGQRAGEMHLPHKTIAVIGN